MAKKTKSKEKNDQRDNDRTVKKSIIKKENRQLAWFIAIVIVGFIIFFGIYLYLEKSKEPEKFNYIGVDWTVEPYEDFTTYHARFQSFAHENLTYNLYLRNDPRENNVSVDGNLTYFKYGGILAFSPEVDECREDVPIATVAFASFLQSVVGMREVIPGTTDFEVYQETGKVFTDCSISNRVVFIIQKGNESSVVQSPKNPYCYTITIKDCEDVLPIEKFIIETMRERNNNLE
ncbi:MAG: hypothetical protein WC548_02995 [Candidatus Pacearchaeota archaeon]